MKFIAEVECIMGLVDELWVFKNDSLGFRAALLVAMAVNETGG